jgi:2-dehydropantoate 2-reductase
MRIAVVGPGGLGGRYAVLLSLAGEEVSVIARGAHLEAILRKGLTLRHLDDEVARVKIAATTDPAEVGPVDLVLFCVKTYDLETAAARARPLVGDDTVVLPIQNGVTSCERLARIVGEKAVIGGTTYADGSVVEPGVISFGHSAAPLLFGELEGGASARTRRLLDTFDNAELEAEVRADMPIVLWEKFVAVCATSAVLALMRLPLGNAFAIPECSELLLGVMQEVEAVAHAKGVGLAKGIAQQKFDYMKLNAAPSMRSSQLTDILAGRRLELEALSGAAVRLGKELGVPTPLNRACYAALKPYVDGSPEPTR